MAVTRLIYIEIILRIERTKGINQYFPAVSKAGAKNPVAVLRKIHPCHNNNCLNLRVINSFRFVKYSSKFVKLKSISSGM